MKLEFGGMTKNLRSGIHALSWVDAEKQLAFNDRRKQLMAGFLEACRALKAAGATKVYLDGSFASKKANPADWDACFDMNGVDSKKLDPVLLDMKDGRAAQKKKYLGEMFPAEGIAMLGEPYLSFFQHTREGKPKGIVSIDLGTLP